MASLFHTLVSEPLYNALIALIGVIPGGDVGIAIIGLTIIVKLILFPLTQKTARTNLVSRAIAPKIEEIKRKYPAREEQVTHIMALYREHKINPFSGIVLILIQLPIIIGLYWLFFYGNLPTVDTSRLYSFVHVPDMIQMHFLGLVDMSGRSIVFAVLAGLTQFFHARMTVPASKMPESTSFQENFTHSLNMQMKYVFPVVIGVMAYIVSAAVALYFVTSNTVSIIQEYIVRKKLNTSA